MITLKQIAEQCNVSPSTVSLVLHKPHKISKDVRDKIYDSVIKLGYIREKHLAVKQIGLVFNQFDKDFFGDFYSDVIYGILSSTSDMNMNVRILRRFDMEYYDIHELQGLIFVGKTPDDYYEKAKGFRIPFVNSGHPSYLHPDVPTLYLSRTTNTKNLVQFILNSGHKNIAVIVGEPDPKDIIRKEFIDTIQANNPHFNENLLYVADYDDIQTVEIVWNEIISRKPRVTAVMCANDLLAYYVYRCAMKYNLAIPGDISVTGYDGIHFPRHAIQPTPQLTTVIGNRIQLGIQSLELLNGLIQGKSVKPALIQLSGSLFIGDSVARIK